MKPRFRWSWNERFGWSKNYSLLLLCKFKLLFEWSKNQSWTELVKLGKLNIDLSAAALLQFGPWNLTMVHFSKLTHKYRAHFSMDQLSPSLVSLDMCFVLCLHPHTFNILKIFPASSNNFFDFKISAHF